MKMSEFLRFKVLLPKQCPLDKWSDLLTYSVLHHYTEKGETITQERVAWYSGMTRQTVAASVERLVELGATADYRALPVDWFYKTKGGHLQYWWCFSSNSWEDEHDKHKLPIPAVMVYSYLYHRITAGVKPPKYGYSNQYLAKVLLMSPKTVAASLQNLERCKLFMPVVTGSLRGNFKVAGSLRGTALNWFKMRGTSQVPGLFEPENCVLLQDVAMVHETPTPTAVTPTAVTPTAVTPTVTPAPAPTVEEYEAVKLLSALQYHGLPSDTWDVMRFRELVRDSNNCFKPGWQELLGDYRRNMDLIRHEIETVDTSTSKADLLRKVCKSAIIEGVLSDDWKQVLNKELDHGRSRDCSDALAT